MVVNYKHSCDIERRLQAKRWARGLLGASCGDRLTITKILGRFTEATGACEDQPAAIERRKLQWRCTGLNDAKVVLRHTLRRTRKRECNDGRIKFLEEQDGGKRRLGGIRGARGIRKVATRAFLLPPLPLLTILPNHRSKTPT